MKETVIVGLLNLRQRVDESLCLITEQNNRLLEQIKSLRLEVLGVHRLQNFAMLPDPDPCRILTCQIRIRTGS